MGKNSLQARAGTISGRKIHYHTNIPRCKLEICHDGHPITSNRSIFAVPQIHHLLICIFHLLCLLMLGTNNLNLEPYLVLGSANAIL